MGFGLTSHLSAAAGGEVRGGVQWGRGRAGWPPAAPGRGASCHYLFSAGLWLGLRRQLLSSFRRARVPAPAGKLAAPQSPSAPGAFRLPGQGLSQRQSALDQEWLQGAEGTAGLRLRLPVVWAVVGGGWPGRPDRDRQRWGQGDRRAERGPRRGRGEAEAQEGKRPPEGIPVSLEGSLSPGGQAPRRGQTWAWGESGACLLGSV